MVNATRRETIYKQTATRQTKNEAITEIQDNQYESNDTDYNWYFNLM